MIGYHTRLAVKSLRRNPVLSTVMVVSLAIGISVWVTARAALEGARRNPLPEHTALYLGRVARPPQWTDVLHGKRYEDLERFSQLYVTAPEAAVLERAAGPARRSAVVEAQVVVGGPHGGLHSVGATLASRDLFAMFDLRLSRGAPWSAAADAGAAREVIIDDELAARLFGTSDVVGRSVDVAGTPHRIVGTIARQNKVYVSSFLKSRFTDEIFLPFASVRGLDLRPAAAHFHGDPATTLDELLASRDRWLFYWVELPDAAARARFVAGAVAAGVQLAPMPFGEALPAINFVHPAYDLLYVFAQIALVAAALNLLRLLLAKFASRVAETGIHRAMGASRRHILAQHVIESTLIGLAGGLLGLAIGWVDILIMNGMVPDRPADPVVDLLAVLVTLGVAALIGTVTGGYSAWRATRLPPALFLRRAA